MKIKNLISILCVVVLLCSNKNYAAVTISIPIKNVTQKEKIADSNILKLFNLTTKNFEKSTGFHLSFKQKVALRILKIQVKLFGSKKVFATIDDEKYKKRALWAKWLGIGSLIGLVLPIVGILSLPAAILAIIFGATSAKNLTDKRNARQGIYFGIATLALILIAIIIVIAIIASLPARTP